MKPEKTLDDYQESSRDFLMGHKLALLADEQGVGKTAPAIVAGWERHIETGLPILITCPSYLCENWEWEISRFAPPSATVVRADGKGPSVRNSALQADASFVISGFSNWSAKSAGRFTYPILSERPWGAVIFDEAHRLRGRKSQCTKHVWELRKVSSNNRSTPIFALTGTPIVNNPGDLYPLLHLWNRVKYRSYWGFVGEYCKITKTPWETVVGPLRKGMEEDFQELLDQFTMRRTLKDIPSLSDLEQIDRDYFVTMPPSVVSTMNKAREEYVIEHENLEKSEFVSGGGALYSKLRQMATNPPTLAKPKIDFVTDFLEDHPGPITVYTWYRGSAKAVAEGLAKTKRPVTLVTGDVPSTRRGELVSEWSSTPNGVLVATISSLREGVSLIHANNVILLESSELSADMDQVIARLKRRGQTECVSVHWVWARSTPDMAIRRAVREREVSIKRALGDWLQRG